VNFCTKCASYYQTPGTCNCYAMPSGITWPSTVPWTPSPLQPTIISPLPNTIVTWTPTCTTPCCTL
jgi:hypothetical protein